jgi:hypothetical protein
VANKRLGRLQQSERASAKRITALQQMLAGSSTER